jgi:hypothetical protein
MQLWGREMSSAAQEAVEAVGRKGSILAIKSLVGELVVELNRFFLLRLYLDLVGHDLSPALDVAPALGGPKVAEP